MSLPTRLVSRLIAFALLSAFAPAVVAAPATAPKPPVARVEVVRDTLHGVVIEDPYRWLEDKNAPETRAWIDAENAYTDALLGPLPGHERVHARLEQLMKIDSQGVPFERGGRYFFSRRLASQDIPVLYLRQGLEGKDEVLVDPQTLSADHTVTVSFVDVTNDGKLMAYGTRQGGEDEVTVAFKDLDTRQDLADHLPRARYLGVSITADRRGVYYSRQTPQGSRVYYHAMGTDPAQDRMLFGEGYGLDKIIGVGLSDDGRWLRITVNYGSATDRTEVYVMDVAAGGPIVPIVNDVPAYFSGRIAGDTMYLKTNWDASNYRIFAVDLRHPARDQWKEIVPAGDAVIDDFSLSGGKLFVQCLKDVVSTVRIVDPAGKPLGTIAFPTLGSAGAMTGQWDKPEAFYTFASFHVPLTIYRYDTATGKQTVWWRAPVPIKSDQMEVKQVWYASKDGTKIPMFLVCRKGLKLDGSNPTLLTGYGGFSVSETPGFSARAALWVESGGVYALPNLRGGGEFGEAWHKAGMLDKKQNVFDDFVAAGEWLIANKYTRADRLCISGGSNGGLLVGAAFTQRPDLFRAVVCSVPLLDMLRYQNFLVARFWVPEYGSAEDADQFKFIRAYSPYQNVKPGTPYPAVLFVSGDSDTRVDPLHARKMCARVQASTGSDRPVLLQYDTKAGHSGGKPIPKQIDDLTQELMFLSWQLGVTLAPGGPAGAKAALPAESRRQ
ncbi:MAG: S9 family peptidase [Candidatus Eisenbacteria bacterium]|uniref:prolyl oligopeptidase n=1 Tax=Eiseniibacteriota bacterium TaxID=2212470 RepID=A0A538U6A2_UNCEI|nr:MAG: S9 family peptidase [Candidatus Eisenbacteria bacterium]